jgi:hypothetical protein
MEKHRREMQVAPGVKLGKLNSQRAEQINSRLEKVRTQVR